MPDTRFFQTLQPLSVADIAARIGGEVGRGGERIIRSIAPLSSADEGAIAFLGDRKFAAQLAETRAGCVIVHPSAAEAAPTKAAVIVSTEPQASWARASALLHLPVMLDVAFPAEDAAEDDSVRIGPGVVLGEGVRVGRGTRIGANTVIVDYDLPFGTAGLDFNQDPVQGVVDALSQPDRLDATLMDSPAGDFGFLKKPEGKGFAFFNNFFYDFFLIVFLKNWHFTDVVILKKQNLMFCYAIMPCSRSILRNFVRFSAKVK